MMARVCGSKWQAALGVCMFGLGNGASDATRPPWQRGVRGAGVAADHSIGIEAAQWARGGQFFGSRSRAMGRSSGLSRRSRHSPASARTRQSFPGQGSTRCDATPAGSGRILRRAMPALATHHLRFVHAGSEFSASSQLCVCLRTSHSGPGACCFFLCGGERVVGTRIPEPAAWVMCRGVIPTGSRTSDHQFAMQAISISHVTDDAATFYPGLAYRMRPVPVSIAYSRAAKEWPPCQPKAAIFHWWKDPRSGASGRQV